MGHFRSKTRSLGEILEKSCVRSRGHIFSLIIMKLSENVCLEEILGKFEHGSYWVKNMVTSSSLRKTLCTLWRPHFQSSNHETWSECLS